jgi:hypothetical protein
MSKFKVGDLVTLTPKAKIYLTTVALDDAPWKVTQVKSTMVWVERKLSGKGYGHIFHEIHLMPYISQESQGGKTK